MLLIVYWNCTTRFFSIHVKMQTCDLVDWHLTREEIWTSQCSSECHLGDEDSIEMVEPRPFLKK
jgi:hypothetical protein